jgi:adenylate cyclase
MGLTLFTYATSHFINHAFGIHSIAAFQAAGLVLLKPWQTVPGHLVLYTAFLVHGALGLYALYRRRHLRIPASERWQLAFGLAIPFLLIPHAVAIAIGKSAYGLEFGYRRVLYEFWVVSPDLELPRQYLLLVTVWIHGCIGLRSWLRSKAWYPQAAPALASLATLMPALALIGFTNAGLSLREAAQRDPVPAASHYLVAPPGTQASQDYALLLRITDAMSHLLDPVARSISFLRDWHFGAFSPFHTYPRPRRNGAVGLLAAGSEPMGGNSPRFSVRCGRCSTCRVRITSGRDGLHRPGPVGGRPSP